MTKGEMNNMEELDVKYWQEEFDKALKTEGIVDEYFFDFMKGKIKRISLKAEEFGWGVFPITDEAGILYDIRMIVPTIYDVKSLCVNIHEYTHAYEVYLELGKIYVWNVEESEQRAKAAEKRYLKSLNNNGN